MSILLIEGDILIMQRVQFEDDQNRCQGTGAHGGQCLNLAQPGKVLCKQCGYSKPTGPEEEWLVDQFEQRMKLKCTPGEEIKLLRENLTSINALIAARLKLVKDEATLIAHSGPLSGLLVSAEKITSSLVKLEREADQLLGKPALIKWGQRICQAVAARIEEKFDGWEDTLLELSEDVGDIISEASNKNEDNS